MHNPDERIALVHQKVEHLSTRKRRRTDALFASAICMLWGCLVFVAAAAGTSQPNSSETLYGASLFGDAAGSYALVALVSLVAAVALTVLCLRRRAQRTNPSHPARTTQRNHTTREASTRG